MDCSPPGSSVLESLQVRILEFIAMPSSRGSSLLRDRTWNSCTASGLFTAEPPGKCPQWRTWVASSNCNLDSVVKNPPTMQETQETWIRHLDWDDILEEENGNALQFFCLKNPADRRAGRLQSKGWQRVRYDWLSTHQAQWQKICGDQGSIPDLGRSLGEGNGQPTPLFLPGKSHGQRSLAGYSPWGCKELDTI